MSLTIADCPRAESRSLADFAGVMTPSGASRAPRLELKPDEVKNGLGKLVLTIVELLRELLERQAIRRMEAGSLTDDVRRRPRMAGGEA